MKTITMTKGYSTKVDDEDFFWLSKHKWHAHINDKGRVYATRFGPVWMHRAIMGDSPLQVDHINGDTLDNRRDNLRFATASQNAHAMHKRRKNTGRPVGVNEVKNTKGRPWKAEIMCRGVRFYLGCFQTAEEAGRAYERKARELFGDYHVSLE